MTAQQTLTLFMTAWMVCWWIFEILPLGITALIPLIFLPLLQIAPLKQVSTEYSNPVIYLFLGGFMIAKALEVTKLSERIALWILTLTGKSDKGILFGFGLSTFLLSMWISNTATTVMMLPIVVSVMSFLRTHFESRRDLKNLNTALLLCIAYSSSIGGIATPIGTPPNVVLVGYLNELFQIKIDFWRWIVVVGPVAFALFLLQYVSLKLAFPFQLNVEANFISFVKDRLRKLGPMDSGQKITVTVFVCTAMLWMLKDVIHKLVGFEFLNDTSIALLGGVALFLVPQTRWGQNPVLTAAHIPSLPWNILLLFGGGMAMANSLESAGIIKAVTEAISQYNLTSPYLLVLALAVTALVLTEIMSNVALCVVALPIMMQLGVSYGISPILIGLPVAICSSFAFTMPVSTPPNAIVFGTNEVTVRDMMKAGLILNAFGVVCVMSLGWWLMNWLLI